MALSEMLCTCFRAVTVIEGLKKFRKSKKSFSKYFELKYDLCTNKHLTAIYQFDKILGVVTEITNSKIYPFEHKFAKRDKGMIASKKKEHYINILYMKPPLFY